MNTILPPTAETFLKEQESFARFRRALRRQDQLVLDDLFAAAGQHLAAASLALHATPMEILLLCMLLEEKKDVGRLRAIVEEALAAASA